MRSCRPLIGEYFQTNFGIVSAEITHHEDCHSNQRSNGNKGRN
jgi:hypothetical protein